MTGRKYKLEKDLNTKYLKNGTLGIFRSPKKPKKQKQTNKQTNKQKTPL